MRVGLRLFRVGSAFCAHREQEHLESVLGELKTCFCSVIRRVLNHTQDSFLISIRKDSTVPYTLPSCPASRHTSLINLGFHLIYSDVISTLFLSMILSDSIGRPGSIFLHSSRRTNYGTYKKQHSPQCSSPYPSELGNTTPRPSTPFHQLRWYSMKQCPSTDKRW